MKKVKAFIGSASLRLRRGFLQLDFTQISTILGLSSVIIGIIASLHSIRRFARERKLSIFLEFSKLLYDKEFIRDMNEIQAWKWETVDEFFSKYGPEADPEAFAKYVRVGSYFDGMSTLVRKKFVDRSYVPETTAIALTAFWERFAPTADEFAVAYRRPSCWDSIKYLYNQLQT